MSSPSQCPVRASVQSEPVSSPVSYTDLRAHETVLDLVCRVRLEQKDAYSEQHTMLRPDKTTLTHVTATHIEETNR